jgi:hypothetical protein
MPSKARKAFDESAAEVDRLIELHKIVGGAGPGRKHQLEVLNKSAIVLITAIWEAYCEDIAAEALEFIVEQSKDENGLPKEIKQIIPKDLKKDAHELAVWKLAGDGWRVVASKRLDDLRKRRNWDFSSPKTENINKLFKEALGQSNISEAWHWKHMSAKDAGTKLDRFVELRGAIAHRGKGLKPCKKSDVTDYFEHVKVLVGKTGGVVNKFAQNATGSKLW